MTSLNEPGFLWIKTIKMPKYTNKHTRVVVLSCVKDKISDLSELGVMEGFLLELARLMAQVDDVLTDRS